MRLVHSLPIAFVLGLALAFPASAEERDPREPSKIPENRQTPSEQKLPVPKDPRVKKSVGEPERKLPVPKDSRVNESVGEPGVKLQDGELVTGPDGATVVVGGTHSTVQLESFTVVAAPELGPRTVRATYQADPASAASHFRFHEVGQSPGPWRSVQQTPTLQLSCGEGAKQLRFQLKGEDIPNPNLPSQQMENLSNLLQQDYAVPDALKTRIVEVFPGGNQTFYPGTPYSALLEVVNFTGGTVSSSEFMGTGCMKVMDTGTGGTASPDEAGLLKVSLDTYFQGPGACTPYVHVPDCPGQIVHADQGVNVSSLETKTVSNTWELQGLLDFSDHDDPLPNVCSGVNEAKVGVQEQNGDIAIEVRPTPAGARCLYSSLNVKLPDGVFLVSTDWSVHKNGLCKVNSKPKFARGKVVLRSNGTLGLEPPMIEQWGGGQVLYDGVIQGEYEPNYSWRYAAWLPMLVELECPPGPPGSGFVRVELESVTVRRPPGESWPSAQ